MTRQGRQDEHMKRPSREHATPVKINMSRTKRILVLLFALLVAALLLALALALFAPLLAALDRGRLDHIPAFITAFSVGVGVAISTTSTATCDIVAVSKGGLFRTWTWR